MSTFNRIDLSGVGFARLDEYFGLWAMEPSRFWHAWERASQMDLKAHVEQTPPAKASVRTGAVAMNDTPDTFGRQGQSIAIIHASGVLMKQVPSGEHGSSTVLLRRVIRDAAMDSSIAGVILIIDSPGGTVSGTSDFAADITLAAEHKPVWAFIEDLGASAAFWAACACDRIYANHRTAAVGSIGTVMGLFDSSKHAEKEGIEAVMFASGDLKGAGFPGTPITPKQRAYFQQLIIDTQVSFAQAVADGRGLTAEQVEELSTGGVWLADEALELGLIDGIQSLDETISQMRDALVEDNTINHGGAGAAHQQEKVMPRNHAGKPASRDAKSTLSPIAKGKAAEEEKPKTPEPEAPKAEELDEDEPKAQDTPTGDEKECDCEGEEGCDCDKHKTDEPAAKEEEEEEKPKAKPSGVKPSAQAAAQDRAAEGQRFLDAFGDQGAVYFAQGKTFAQAQELHTAALQKENAELKARLESAGRGASAPIPLQSGSDKPAYDTKLATNVGTGVARYAAGTKLPASK